MKQNKNEQTNSYPFHNTVIPSTTLSIHLNENKDLEDKTHKSTTAKKQKIKVYHPKMMIAYNFKI
jgi:hypothetical protein